MSWRSSKSPIHPSIAIGAINSSFMRPSAYPPIGSFIWRMTPSKSSRSLILLFAVFANEPSTVKASLFP